MTITYISSGSGYNTFVIDSKQALHSFGKIYGVNSVSIATHAESVYAGDTHHIYVSNNTHNAITWGSNSKGQLGTGNTTDIAFPGVTFGGYNRVVTSAAVGNGFSYVAYDSFFSCFGYLADEYFVCNRHGVCIDADACNCETGYSGDSCEAWTCFDIAMSNTSVCSGNGQCVALDTCGMWFSLELTFSVLPGTCRSAM